MKEISHILTGERVVLKAEEATFEMAKKMYDVVVADRKNLLPYMEWATEEITSKAEGLYDFLNDASQKRKDKKKYEFCIFVNGEFLGGIGVFNISESGKSAEIGYWLKKSGRGKGYMSEAVKVIEEEFFSGEDSFNKLRICCDSENDKSASVAKRLGYHLDGIMREEHWSTTKKCFVDYMVFTKLKREWAR